MIDWSKGGEGNLILYVNFVLKKASQNLIKGRYLKKKTYLRNVLK